MNEVLTTLASVPFAVACTALLRKRWPGIDGAYVALVVLACTVLAAVLSHYSAHIPGEVWIAAGPVIAAVMALGGVQAASAVAGKSTTRVIELHQQDSFAAREAPTKKD